MEDEFKDQLEKLLCFLFPSGTVEPKMVAGTNRLRGILRQSIEFERGPLGSIHFSGNSSLFFFYIINY